MSKKPKSAKVSDAVLLPIEIPPDVAVVLEAQRFTVAEIARWFALPENLVSVR